MTYGDFRWDDKGVPAGPAWVWVDLDSQMLSVFRSGHEIGTAVILYGADGVPTPTGKFPILAKLKDHRSITYDNAPMPYTLRLTPTASRSTEATSAGASPPTAASAFPRNSQPSCSMRWRPATKS